MLAYFVSIRPRRQGGTDGLDSAGILQLTWLLGNDDHFVEIERPEQQTLRRAGMFDVQMSTWVKQRIELKSVKTLSSSRTANLAFIELNGSRSESNSTQ